MPMQRFLAASLLLAASCSPLAAQSVRTTDIASAAAATPAATQDNVRHIPAMSFSTLAVQDGRVKYPETTFVLPETPVVKLSRNRRMMSRNEGLCYTMRDSRFTDEDLASDAPHASSHTTCTPASGIRMKSADVVRLK